MRTTEHRLDRPRRPKHRGLPRPGPVSVGLAAATAVCAAVFAYNATVLSAPTPTAPSAESAEQLVSRVAEPIGTSVALTGSGVVDYLSGANSVTTCLDQPERVPGPGGATAP